MTPLAERSAEIFAVGCAFPPHHGTQAEVTAMVRRLWGRAGAPEERIGALHRNTRVRDRHLALPLAEYPRLGSFAAANEVYVRVAAELGEIAVQDALERARLTAAEIDHVFFVSTTGIATPSIDARLVNRLGFRPDVKRTPIFGLGCAGGAGGVARASDYLRGFPSQVALLVAVEICSLTVQLGDRSVPNLIATGLFGDGAAAVVLAGADRRRDVGPSVVACRSVFYPDTEHVMGWDVTDGGFKIVLSADVPNVVRDHLRGDADRFLADHGLSRADLGCYVCHPGGPRVIEALKDALEITDDALSLTWATLEEIGNVSSVSVLLVLRERLGDHRPAPGTWGLMTAMGPGFGSELVLLRW